MSTSTRSANGSAARAAPGPLPATAGPHPRSAAGELQLAAVFTRTVARYLHRILPQLTAEMKRWRSAAAAIPDPRLRRTAHAALAGRGNIEGAALFATLTPPQHQRASIRALAAFQLAYNYLDALSEQPAEDPLTNTHSLHQALLIALTPAAPHPDYYQHNPGRQDGGFLPAIVDACRGALAALPSSAAVADAAQAAACRIIDFQTLNLPTANGDPRDLRAWATQITPAGALCSGGRAPRPQAARYRCTP